MLPLPRLHTVVLAFTAALVLPMQTAAQVHGPRLVSNQTPDLHDLESYVRSVVKPGMTQKERTDRQSNDLLRGSAAAEGYVLGARRVSPAAATFFRNAPARFNSGELATSAGDMKRSLTPFFKSFPTAL